VIAERALCALLTELIYTFLPIGNRSTSWVQFVGSWVALALVWDFYFFLTHRAFHLNKTLYRLFHKTHHTYKDPNCFTAYYVSYCSHLITEQLFIFGAALVCPSDVLIGYLYYGTVGTYLNHSGYELTAIKLPFIGLSIGNLMPTVPGLGQDAAHHDLHHEKFFNNYALSYTHLDALGGYLVPGRVPGQQPPKKKPAAAAEYDGTPTAAGTSAEEPPPGFASANATANAAASAAAAVRHAAASSAPERPSTPPLSSEAPDAARPVASFTALKDSTTADVELMTARYNEENGKNLVNRVLGMLKDQDRPELVLGTQVTLYEHGLQTATRALRDGASEDYVVGALLHDIGEMHCPSNHGEVPASILRPFLEPEVSWVLEQHEVFQMYYYAHKVGPEEDRHRRDMLKVGRCRLTPPRFCIILYPVHTKGC